MEASLRPCILRLRRTLTKAQRLLRATDPEADARGLDKRNRAEFLRCVRRLGVLLFSAQLQLRALGEDACRDEAVSSLLCAARSFLADAVSLDGSQSGVPVPCVGLLCREHTPRPPFAVSAPFLVQEDSCCMCEPARILSCVYHRDEEPISHAVSPCVQPNEVSERSHAVPAASDEEAAHAQVMEDIREAIKGMKEGAIRMSDLMQQERMRLDANAELLQRGIDGTSTQSRRMDKLGHVFGVGPPPPSCLSKIPGAKLFWQTVVAPMWVVIRQAVFLCIIVATTCSVLLLMVAAPKTYVYAPQTSFSGR
ncbi:hypothetical protein TraAM80_01151 [Trypanosoma rangeli]|uniref:Uncharacterized protein n=1 Tax=Trypanosoma rangeli TaxID=5698 RepID=A0A422P031_TRYRA|nr:uncharacterized protein TraAM80_01151 [Trypanosoma rangeli]RNF11024.1 hypothetical protein TraAM80_01151 [Trypanosoma rangeli]|eukprot:RNF11024.1 hypothetical protein TraAM80_01151 [Trypanosoma rangeli]